MKLFDQIKQIDVQYIGKQDFIRLEGYTFENKNSVPLPARFYVNGTWRISHACIYCSRTVITGAEEPVMTKQHNFRWYPYVNEKYFSKRTLEVIASLFRNVFLINREGKNEILPVNYDPVFPLPISLFEYKCESCFINYLAQYAYSAGSNTERGERPMPGMIAIEEIVCVGFEVNDDFKKSAGAGRQETKNDGEEEK